MSGAGTNNVQKIPLVFSSGQAAIKRALAKIDEVTGENLMRGQRGKDNEARKVGMYL